MTEAPPNVVQNEVAEELCGVASVLATAFRGHVSMCHMASPCVRGMGGKLLKVIPKLSNAVNSQHPRLPPSPLENDDLKNDL